MRKLVISCIVFILSIGIILQGCEIKTPSGFIDGYTPNSWLKSSHEAVGTSVKNSVTIKVASMYGWTKDVDRQLAQEFERETGTRIIFQLIPDDQYSKYLKSSFDAGEGPDIYLAHSGIGMLEYLTADKLLDLSNEPWTSRMTDWARNGVTYKGRVIAFNTWSVDGWGMLYNPDIFKKCGVGVPDNFQDFLKVCEKIKSSGIIPIYQPGKTAWHNEIWLNSVSAMVAQKNEGLYDKLNTNQIKTVNLKELETALGQLGELASKGYFGEDFMKNTWEVMPEMMGSGKYAMGLVPTTFQNQIMERAPDSGAKAWNMFPVPLAGNRTFATSAGGVVRCVNKDSKVIKEIKAYFNFLSTGKNIKTLYSARLDLGPTSFIDVEGNITEAYKSVIKNSEGGTGVDFECSILYWDQAAVGKLIQNMYFGGRKPKQVLEDIDSERAKQFNAQK